MLRFALSMLALAAMLTPSALHAGLPSRFHDIAQVGDGGGIRTVFLVLNQNAQPVTVAFRFFRDDGSALTLTLEGISGSTISVTVPAGGMRRLATSGASPTPQVGWAKLNASAEVGAQALFEVFAEGQLVTQAAVESPGPVDVFDLFVEQGGGSSPGVAIANLSSAGPVRIRLTLKDENGTTLGTQDITLAALGHIARFVSELFPQAAAQIRGTLRVQCSGPVTVVALQQTGAVLGTLPVVEILL